MRKISEYDDEGSLPGNNPLRGVLRGDADFMQIVSYLSGWKGERLDLSGNSLGPRSAWALAMDRRGVDMDIDMSDNPIGNVGAAALFSLPVSHPRDRILRNTGIDSRGGMMIAHEIRKATVWKFRVVDLSNNRLLDAGVREILAAILEKRRGGHVRIARLNLRGTGLTAASADLLVAVLRNNAVDHLLVGNNDLGSKGCEIIAASRAANSGGGRPMTLDLTETGCDAETASRIRSWSTPVGEISVDTAAYTPPEWRASTPPPPPGPMAIAAETARKKGRALRTATEWATPEDRRLNDIDAEDKRRRARGRGKIRDSSSSSESSSDDEGPAPAPLAKPRKSKRGVPVAAASSGGDDLDTVVGAILAEHNAKKKTVAVSEPAAAASSGDGDLDTVLGAILAEHRAKKGATAASEPAAGTSSAGGDLDAVLGALLAEHRAKKKAAASESSSSSDEEPEGDSPVEPAQTPGSHADPVLFLPGDALVDDLPADATPSIPPRWDPARLEKLRARMAATRARMNQRQAAYLEQNRAVPPESSEDEVDSDRSLGSMDTETSEDEFSEESDDEFFDDVPGSPMDTEPAPTLGEDPRGVSPGAFAAMINAAVGSRVDVIESSSQSEHGDVIELDSDSDLEML